MTHTFFCFSHDKRAGSRRFCIWLGLLLALFAANEAVAFPQIDLQSGSKNVPTGTSLNFAVQVSQKSGSKPPLSVQWRRNGQNIPGALTNFTDGSGISRLIITNAQPADSGIYYAVVFDADGVVRTTNVSLTISDLTAAPFADAFTSRENLTKSQTASGSAGGNNINATPEKGEPDHGGKKARASVWVSWVPPFSGLARFDTRGSDFDTTLGIYVIKNSKSPDSVTNLTAVAEDDDSGGYFNSAVVFNVVSNREYEIAVDGFYDDQGDIVVNWSVEKTDDLTPPILTQPQSLTVANNASATFSVTVNTNITTHTPSYQWYLNGNAITEGTAASLTISAVKPQDVGEYYVSIYFTGQKTFTNTLVVSQPVQLQINAQGNTGSAAQSKFREETDPTIGPQFVFHPNAVPVSGYTGTHIWNTYGAESEPGEPDHCGKAGGAPYWFSYQAPADGTLTVDANTPTFTNVLAIYTGPGDSFDTLKTYACASTNSGVGHEVAAFPVANGTVYWIVVDGLNGAVGNVTLNYNLTVPPAITAQPQSQTVSQGSNVTLTVAATGTPVPSYQWRTNTINFPGQISGSLTVSNFQSAKAGNYDVVVANTAGSVTSSVATLYLNSPARFGNFGITATGGFTATLLGAANTNYVIQASSNLVNWIPIATNKSPYGVISVTDTNGQNYPGRFYRAISQ